MSLHLPYLRLPFTFLIVPFSLDFSDSLAARRRKGKGFLPEQTEFEIQDEVSAAKDPETPLQRFHRLQLEVKQLHEELAAAAKVPINS